MTEHVVRSVSSGTGPTTPNKVSDTGPATGGKEIPAFGKPLPEQSPRSSAPDLEEFVQHLNYANRALGRVLHFKVDLDKGYAVIQVLDRETGELIRQIPPEKFSPYVSGNGGLAMRLYDESV